MHSSLDVRRFARRAVGPVCASIAAVLVAITINLSSPSARAQAAPVAPALAAATKETPRAAAAAIGPAISPLPTEPGTLITASGADVVVYPPLVDASAKGQGAPPADASAKTEGAPLVVMLHGMCCDPAPTCDFWSRAGREGSFLICPEGNATCGGAGDWKGTGEVKAAAIDEGLALVDRMYGPHIAHDKGDILMGFSRGAFVARDVAYARPGKYKGLILIGAYMRPDPALFKASGIRRVVMAAGDYDMARPAMQRSVAELSARGLPARYISLGRIGHALPDNFEELMRGAIAWVRQGIEAGDSPGS